MLANWIESFIDESGGGRVFAGNRTSQIIASAELGADELCYDPTHGEPLVVRLCMLCLTLITTFI